MSDKTKEAAAEAAEAAAIAAAQPKTVRVIEKYVINQRVCFSIGAKRVLPEYGAFTAARLAKDYGITVVRAQQIIENMRDQGILNLIEVRDGEVVPEAVETAPPAPEAPAASIWTVAPKDLKGMKINALNALIAQTSAENKLDPPEKFTNTAGAIAFLGKDLPED